MRSIKRKLESERWDQEEHDWVANHPWKPYGNSDEDDVHIRPPQPVTPVAGQAQAEKQRDGEVVPITFSIQRKDLINYGYTPGCPGCYAAANDRRHKPHTTLCRSRLEKAMLEDESQSNRIKDARAREDAFLEQKVREAHEASKSVRQEVESAINAPNPNVHVNPPTPISIDQTDAQIDVQPTQTPMSWEDMLQENNFHDIVNDDEEMYGEIGDVSIEDQDMVNQIIGIVQNHVSEVWSPPRVTKLAHEYDLKPGFSFDIQTNDENGSPWDFDVPLRGGNALRESYS